MLRSGSSLLLPLLTARTQADVSSFGWGYNAPSASVTPLQHRHHATALSCQGAYVSLLSVHNSTSLATATAKEIEEQRLRNGSSDAMGKMMRRQLQLVLVLVRSLRRVEAPKCRRPFLLIGSLPPIKSSSWRSRLDREGVILTPTPVLVPGSPSTDKLSAWALTQYRRLLFIDSDVMVLKAMDEEMFDEQNTFTIAHDESDLVQAQCDVPRQERVLGAMFSLEPKDATHASLMAALPRFAANAYVMKRYSEQPLLACHFNSTRKTLPCGYLFNLNNPASTTCRYDGRPPEICLRIFRKHCQRHSATTVRRACLLGGGDTQSTECTQLVHAHSGAAACDAVVRHASAHCRWSNTTDIRAVHFMGSKKPWATPCMDAKLGSFRLAPPGGFFVPASRSRDGGSWYLKSGTAFRTAPVDPLADAITWDDEQLECRSNVTRRLVLSASGVPISERQCCGLYALLAARWYGFLQNKSERFKKIVR